MLALQLLLPTSFWISNVYSPLSFFSVEIIFSIETVSVTLILYFWPRVSSWPSLNHLAIISLVPENLTCKVAGSPWVTSIDTASSVIVAGSVENKRIRVGRELLCWKVYICIFLPKTFWTNLLLKVTQNIFVFLHRFWPDRRISHHVWLQCHWGTDSPHCSQRSFLHYHLLWFPHCLLTKSPRLARSPSEWPGRQLCLLEGSWCSRSSLQRLGVLIEEWILNQFQLYRKTGMIFFF